MAVNPKTDGHIEGSWRHCGCIELPSKLIELLDGYGADGVAASAMLDDGEKQLFCVAYYEHGYPVQIAVVALGMADELHSGQPSVIRAVLDTAKARGFDVQEHPPATRET